MKNNCNIARDLMPLVIDQAASEDSTQYVHTHLDQCESCRSYYDGMKHLSDNRKSQIEEQALFDRAAQRIKKNRRLRLLRNTLIGVLIGCLLAWGGLSIWSHLMHNYNQLIYHGFYGVTLSELKEGEVSVNIDYYGSSLICGVELDRVQEDGKEILYVYLERPFIKQYAQNPLRNYSCTRLSPESVQSLYEIRQGKGDEYVVVWQKGMEIPAASEEMEAYFVLYEQYRDLWNEQEETPDGKAIIRSKEHHNQITMLRDQMNKITVPEWQ